MRKWITFLMTLLVGSSVSYVNADSGQLTFEAGYRRDNINWRHKVPACDPIFETTTKFEDIDIFEIGLKARAMMGCNFYMRAAASWGWILDGDFKRKVSTFASPCFDDFSCGSIDFSEGFAFTARNRDVIDDRYVYDLNIAVGYPFYFCDCTMALSPVLGYAVDEQLISVDINDIGFESCSFSDESCGSFLFPVSGCDCCCRHKFSNRWYGPFIGLDFLYRPCGECWSFYGELEYHYARFKAKFHNEHELFFEGHGHRSHHAHGWVFALGADYDFACDWTVGLALKCQDWSASRHHRHDCRFGSDDSGDRQRNKHKWQSCAIKLALGKNF